jgi:flavin reductase (DIM6/NTAB) family NADH-FMN oxidoreductase RutF
MSGGHNRWNGEAVTASSTQDFREAMSAFPSGVTVVTTTDAEGRWWGFTATSFCSVSAEPPLVLVCLAETAECHPVFAAATDWIIHVLAADHGALALRFATRGADKFGESDFVAGPFGVLRHPALSALRQLRGGRPHHSRRRGAQYGAGGRAPAGAVLPPSFPRISAGQL